MTLKKQDKTERALAMIGTPRENGTPHTAYSADKACGVSLQTIYKHTKRLKATALAPHSI